MFVRQALVILEEPDSPSANCAPCHLPYSQSSAPASALQVNCAVCRSVRLVTDRHQVITDSRQVITDRHQVITDRRLVITGRHQVITGCLHFFRLRTVAIK